MTRLYQQNLKSLSNINQSLANKVDELEIDKEKFEVISTKQSNDYTIRLSIEKKQKLVHSLYRPHNQAQKKIEKLKLGYYNLIGVAGIGCGHYIREILNNFNQESQLIIIENRLDILKAVMKKQDLTDILIPRNVKIFDGSTNEYINQLKEQMRRIDYNSLIAGNVDFFYTPGLFEIEKDKYKKFRKRFFSTLNFVARTVGNDPGDTLLGLKNALANIDKILKTSELDNINKYKNKPVVCVAAGPSLDKNIDVLKEYQEQVLIIAADTILGKLLKNGIVPDMVGILERVEKVYSYFFKDLIENNQLPKEITLVSEGIANPKIYNNFPGKVISVFRDNVPIEKWFINNIEGVTGFNTGNSVANLNFSVAKTLGCSPIILVGQDLAYDKDGNAHSSETKYEEVGEKNNKQEETYVEGYNGEKLKARKWWKIFKDWFEYQIAATGIHCIDATEGGAYIEGTEIMKLEEVAEQYFEEEINDFSQQISSVEENKIKDRTNQMKSSIEEKINMFDEIKEEIDDINDLIMESKEQLAEEKNVLEFVEEKFIEINTKVAKMSGKDSIFFFICQSLFIQMERYKVQMGDLSFDTKDKFITWCNYDLDKLDDLTRICDITIDILENGLDNISKLQL